MKRCDLIALLDKELEPWHFKDYAPNGLQVEGKNEIHKIITGVTASQALIDRAIEKEADAILVHHGYFWKNEPLPITGMKYQRIKRLLEHDINLIAYHLPLDAHKTLGNNAQLAEVCQWQVDGKVEEELGLLWLGHLAAPMIANIFVSRLSEQLSRKALAVGPQEKIIRKIAWCSGGAQTYLAAAVSMGVDAFISGEISEWCFHMAEENNILYISAGHHATERYGIKALGEWLAQCTDVEAEYVELNNPI